MGIQVLGPCLEDATPIDVAARLGEVVGRFIPPPGFERDAMTPAGLDSREQQAYRN